MLVAEIDPFNQVFGVSRGGRGDGSPTFTSLRGPFSSALGLEFTQSAFFSGNTSTGKSSLMTALASEAIVQGMSVIYLSYGGEKEDDVNSRLTAQQKLAGHKKKRVDVSTKYLAGKEWLDTFSSETKGYDVIICDDAYGIIGDTMTSYRLSMTEHIEAIANVVYDNGQRLLTTMAKRAVFSGENVTYKSHAYPIGARVYELSKMNERNRFVCMSSHSQVEFALANKLFPGVQLLG